MTEMAGRRANSTVPELCLNHRIPLGANSPSNWNGMQETADFMIDGVRSCSIITEVHGTDTLDTSRLEVSPRCPRRRRAVAESLGARGYDTIVWPALLLSMLVIGVSGCVSVRGNYRPETAEISEPPLGVIAIANVGDVLVRQGRLVLHDAIYLRQDADVGTFGAYTLRRGYYLRTGEDADSEFYLPGRSDGGGAIVKAALADPPKAVQVYKRENRLCVVTVFNVYTCTTQAEFERTKRPAATTDSFQQTLIYSGRVGDKIRVGYREYSNNLARPAFNNDVEYDLKDSAVIGYKGARIEVLEATNEHMRYKVIRNFAPAY